MITEKEYIKRTDIAHRKKYAQFFTPEPIADFMAEWVLHDVNGSSDVLEPAYGLGVFSRSMSKLHRDIKVKGYDIDENIFQYALLNASETSCHLSLDNQDYLTSSWENKYDAIICNPPYLKFHDYDNATFIPMINKKLQTKLNGFTNIYTLFLLKSIYQLKEGGRLAYIIPSEFLNSDYGVEVKRALLESGTLKHIIIIDFTQCAFDDALTTACILLCQKTKETDIVHFSNIDEMAKLPDALANHKSISTKSLNPETKWKQYYEDIQSSKYNNLVPFSTFAKVSRGIATGANSYFTFNVSRKEYHHIPDCCFRPCICHAVDVKTPIFTQTDFELLVQQDKTVFLFDACADEANPIVKNYLCLGIDNGINKKHLTSSRSPWYSLENRKPSPIWVSVFNRNGLRFVRNKTNAYNLTTFHCVYNISDVNTDVLFAYLVTDMAKEIFLDNSRQYGNGLVKFEPNDLNKGNIVDLRLLTKEEIEFILQVYERLQCYGSVSQQYVELLNDFFITKYTTGQVWINSYKKRLKEIKDVLHLEEHHTMKTERVKQLNFFSLLEQYEYNPIIENSLVCEASVEYHKSTDKYPFPIDTTRNVLICNVKKDNWEQYLNGSARIYYTGKKFPNTVELNKLFYFMPYLSGKGVRDLYYIKIVRLGNRKEGQDGEEKNDIRLVFEIERIGQLYDDYKLVKLEIWRTFTDTTMKEVLNVSV